MRDGTNAIQAIIVVILFPAAAILMSLGNRTRCLDVMTFWLCAKHDR